MDPVSIPVNSNLVGIVGPNGCGKSNIIDAVRWVMGESSAKHLRGGTMADVIFNGSSSRKPVGVASVELVFDNTESVQGGAYAAYDTIAIKRQVTRDGQSVYMLNGSRCRRKDITDIFLGTGLGSRSYAIIEQGTISRLIEAKPDDLRVLIEEAAGISKYKDRRHDTEIRIRHTRENLDRLNDLREEVEKQIDHLKRQAKKAEKFKILKAQEREFRQQLLAIRWKTYQDQVSDYEERAYSCKQALEAALAQQSNLDQSISESRDRQNQLQQSLNAIQADLYATGAEIGRVEQSIKLSHQTQEDIEDELNRLGSDEKRALSELESDNHRLNEIKYKFNFSVEALESARRLESTTTRLKHCIDRVKNDQQTKLDSIRNKLAMEKECFQLESSRIDQISDQNTQLNERKIRLAAEKEELSTHSLGVEISEFSKKIAKYEIDHQTVQTKLIRLKEDYDSKKQSVRELSESLNDIRSKRQNCEGKIASLERLQQHAMGKDRSYLNRWLKDRELFDSMRLAQAIQVENGWETAVELALGAHLEAVCVDSNESLFSYLDELEDETISLVEKGEGNRSKPLEDRTCLSDQVVSSYNVRSLLKGIFCAPDSTLAYSMVSSLEAGESVITQDGFWIGKGWIYLNRSDDPKSGVLAREKELRALNENLLQFENQVKTTEKSMEELETEVLSTENQIEQCQSDERRITSELSEYKTGLGEKTARYEHICQRIAQIDEEISEISKTLNQSELQISRSAEKRSLAEAAVESILQDSARFSEFNEVLHKIIEEFSQVAIDARDELRHLEASLKNLKSSEEMILRHLQRLENQHHQEIERSAELKQKLADIRSPLQEYREEYEHLGDKRKKQEEELKLARVRLIECEKATVELTEQQAGEQFQVEKKREFLEKVRLDGQESRVRTQSVLEQLGELNVDQESIPNLVPDGANEHQWREKVDGLSDKISRLGSINLAAIEEFKEQSERSEYLNQQHDDLVESLDTLENAMQKIDMESKTRFKTTFDQINAGLQIKFPKLFGGGQARLELTEANLLETGVNVIAQPPGKRNASIHLLSGGEKALTAVALVFSIFELNPAPFCMLDEVDAPLDDANVGRFGRLIEEMADRVQFIFITHNKVTMETARHLAGVTMNEPGVSRMVAVDIDEAVELAVS